MARFETALEETGMGVGDGDDEPVRPPGLQGRRVHLQRPRRCGAPRSARRCARSTWAPAGRRGLRLLGRPRGHGGRHRQGPARRARALPRGDRLPRRLLGRPGLRHALRARAEAERAARRHLPAHRRPRAALHHHARRAPTWSASTRRSRTRRWPGCRSITASAQALWAGKLFHIDLNGQRDRPLRPGLPLRRRGPQGGVPPRAAARARRLRRPAALRRARLPQRGRRGRVGLRARAACAPTWRWRTRRGASTRCPRCRRRWRAASGGRARRSVGGRRRRRARSRPRSTGSTRWRRAATATSGSISSWSSPARRRDERPRRARRRHERRQGARRRRGRRGRRRSAEVELPALDAAARLGRAGPRGLVARARRRRWTALGVVRRRRHRLSGQMHGLVALDAAGEVIRPAILWNDQRTAAECAEIEERVGFERLVELTGNRALTGFTAPKLLWLREHEPERYARIAHVLLPKDYVRLRLCGEHAIDVADASGHAAVRRRAAALERRGARGARDPARVAAARARVARGARARRPTACPSPPARATRRPARWASASSRPAPLSSCSGRRGVVFSALDAYRGRPAGARARVLPRGARRAGTRWA